MKKSLSTRRLKHLTKCLLPQTVLQDLIHELAQEVLDLRKQLQERSNNIPEKELQKVFKK